MSDKLEDHANREDFARLKSLFLRSGMGPHEAHQLALDIFELQWVCIELANFLREVGRLPATVPIKDLAGIMGRFQHLRKHERSARKAINRLYDELVAKG